eukprot:scaffold188_cov107-Isochrysis_galbana.AAC.4
MDLEAPLHWPLFQSLRRSTPTLLQPDARRVGAAARSRVAISLLIGRLEAPSRVSVAVSRRPEATGGVPQVSPRWQQHVPLPARHAEHLDVDKLFEAQGVGGRRQRSHCVGRCRAREPRHIREHCLLQPPASFPSLKDVDDSNAHHGRGQRGGGAAGRAAAARRALPPAGRRAAVCPAVDRMAGVASAGRPIRVVVVGLAVGEGGGGGRPPDGHAEQQRIVDQALRGQEAHVACHCAREAGADGGRQRQRDGQRQPVNIEKSAAPAGANA